jgi:hypothetical protein
MTAVMLDANRVRELVVSVNSIALSSNDLRVRLIHSPDA